MDVQVDRQQTRTYTYIRKRTLADGTIREYTYEGKFIPKTNVVQNMGKTELRKRIDKCKDKLVIQAISDLLTESGY